MTADEAIAKAMETAKKNLVLITVKHRIVFDYEIVTGAKRIEKMVQDYTPMCIGVYDGTATQEMMAEDMR